jgi:hypothetical protein
MSELSIRLREDRARRALAKYDYRLFKTPARSSLRKLYDPGYMIVAYNNSVALGAGTTRAYEATLEDVEAFVAELRLKELKAA